MKIGSYDSPYCSDPLDFPYPYESSKFYESNNGRPGLSFLNEDAKHPFTEVLIKESGTMIYLRKDPYNNYDKFVAHLMVYGIYVDTCRYSDSVIVIVSRRADTELALKLIMAKNHFTPDAEASIKKWENK